MSSEALPQLTVTNAGGKNYRDIFLSHRSTDLEFTKKLAADIEVQTHQGRHLSVWLDEAEVRPGQGLVAMINQGLESSRFFGLVLTPAYFQSETGWTDAEWQAALYTDPANRKARIIPLLAEHCPYIPMLLRHLKAIDFRSNRYARALDELLRVLREEPLPRPVLHRGQLIAAGRVDRATLIAERAVIEAYPDPIAEVLSCNLLPVEKLPKSVYSAPIAQNLRRPRADGSEALPTKQQIKDAIHHAQEQKGGPVFTPAFRVVDDRILTLHDLDDPEGSLASVVDSTDIEIIDAMSLVPDDDDRRLLVSLLNMALDRHCRRVGLVDDGTMSKRFFFPPVNGGPNIIKWRAVRNTVARTVAKPCTRNDRIVFWRHLGAYLRIMLLANRFYLHITPTWVITEDGLLVRGGPGVGRLVIKWTGPERNLHLLYHIRFWTAVLQGHRPGPIRIRAGDQTLEIGTLAASVHQAYGIADDQRNLTGVLDAAAPQIAEEEDQLADMAVEMGLAVGEEAEAGVPEGEEPTEGSVPDINVDDQE